MWASSLAFLRNPQYVWTFVSEILQIIWEFVFSSLLVWFLLRFFSSGQIMANRVCVFLTSSCFAEMTHALCPPESKISVFLIWQQSLCYTGGHELAAQGCVGVLIAVVWSLCLPRSPWYCHCDKNGYSRTPVPPGYTLSR